MNRIMTIIVINLFVCFLIANSGWALSSQNVVVLKKAGVSDQTIQVIAQRESDRNRGLQRR